MQCYVRPLQMLYPARSRVWSAPEGSDNDDDDDYCDDDDDGYGD